MKDVIKFALTVINTISFICLFLISMFIFYCEFFGFDRGNEFLQRIKFPLNDNGLIVVGFICLVIMFVSYFTKRKFN